MYSPIYDGTCNNDGLNVPVFKFDGGDCCGTTCSRPNCGKNEFEAFGEIFKSGENGAICYPDCNQPGKVDLSVTLPAADFRDKLDEDDLNACRTFGNPRLKLECGDEENYTVFSIPVNESLFGETYFNIKLESDSVCDFIATNFDPFFGSLNQYSLVTNIIFDMIDTVTVEVLAENLIPTIATNKIADILCKETKVEQMCKLMGQVDNTEDILMNSDSTWTIFAPSSGFLGHFLEGIQFDFEDLFWFHAVEDQKVFKRDLLCSNYIEMMNGFNSSTFCDEDDMPIGQTGDGNGSRVPLARSIWLLVTVSFTPFRIFFLRCRKWNIRNVNGSTFEVA